MTTTITPRIGSSPTADNTKRVITIGAVDTIYGDAWGGTWIGWGNTWSSIIDAVPASPAVDVTARVGAAPTANNTKRVTGI